MKNKYYSMYFVMPQLLIYTALFIVPTLIGMGAAFTDWNTFNDTGIHFIGLEHIKYALFEDPHASLAFRNTFTYALLVMLIQNVVGLGLALLMNMPFKTNGFIRSAFFAPVVFPSLIIAYTFSAILYPEGPFDRLLMLIGMEDQIKYWLVDKQINISVISVVHSWQFMGLAATIYLAGLKTIPPELSEASRIDGASSWHNFRHIMLPLIGPSITMNMVSCFAGVMKAFDLPYLMAGSVTNAPTVMGTVFMYVDQKAYATAINLILVVVIMIIAIPMTILLKRREVDL